jgi:hypothetical protein
MRLQQGDSLKGAALAAATGYVWGVSVLLLATGVLKIVSPPHEAMLSPFAAASFGCVEVVLGLWVLHPRSIIPFQAAIALFVSILLSGGLRVAGAQATCSH